MHYRISSMTSRCIAEDIGLLIQRRGLKPSSHQRSAWSIQTLGLRVMHPVELSVRHDRLEGLRGQVKGSRFPR
jgi:hypothetical protein